MKIIINNEREKKTLYLVKMSSFQFITIGCFEKRFKSTKNNIKQSFISIFQIISQKKEIIILLSLSPKNI